MKRTCLKLRFWGVGTPYLSNSIPKPIRQSAEKKRSPSSKKVKESGYSQGEEAAERYKLKAAVAWHVAQTFFQISNQGVSAQ